MGQQIVEDKKVLGLKLPTDPRWTQLAAKNIEDILSDHAWCEQKAATTCITLIVQYPGKSELVKALTPVVAEEWSHFRAVLHQLSKRNLKLQPQRRDLYVRELLKLIRSGNTDTQFQDKLLTSALIEARSCERFRLLSLELPDTELQCFYHELMVAEAGHYRLFYDLAAKYTDEEATSKRWIELLQLEAEIMKTFSLDGKSIH